MPKDHFYCTGVRGRNDADKVVFGDAEDRFAFVDSFLEYFFADCGTV
jgi:hypothetical protein